MILMVSVLLELSLVAHLKALFEALYGVFYPSPKKFLEFQKMCDVLMKKGNKTL
jgi:hypothetical protein